MEAYKITTEKGITWVTSFNGTLKEAENYFLNNWFNVGNTQKKICKK